MDLIITDDEREVFLQIGDDYQKDKFIESFWKRRSIDSQGLRTDYQRGLHAARREAREQFRQPEQRPREGASSSTGRPTRSSRSTARTSTSRSRSGTTSGIEVLKSKVYLIFYEPYGVGRIQALAAARRRRAFCRSAAASSARRPDAPGGRRVDITRCTEWRTLRAGDRVLDGRARVGRRRRWRARASSSSRRSSRPRASTRS